LTGIDDAKLGKEIGVAKERSSLETAKDIEVILPPLTYSGGVKYCQRSIKSSTR
jgi:hypothetical protein